MMKIYNKNNNNNNNNDYNDNDKGHNFDYEKLTWAFGSDELITI